MVLFLSCQVTIVDPTKLSFTDLSGHERVGVINRNTQERVSPGSAYSAGALRSDRSYDWVNLLGNSVQ